MIILRFMIWLATAILLSIIASEILRIVRYYWSRMKDKRKIKTGA